MTIHRDIAYGAEEEQRLDLYLPEGEGPFDLFLYFHGGGLTKGSKRSGGVIASYLVPRGVAVVSADYRLMPKNAYPSFLEDAALACAFCKRMAEEQVYGRMNRLFVGGSSAGGYLSMMLCFDPQWLDRVGMTVTEIAGFLHDAGQPTTHFALLAARGLDSKRVIVDETAPLYHVRAGMTLPPMHFVVSDQDLPGRYAQTMLLLETLRIFGHDAPKITAEVRQGKHCHYSGARDEGGESILGQMVYALIARC